MSRVDFTIWCDGCGAEILGVPIVRAKHDFCCQACLRGFRCECCTWDSLDDDRPVDNDTEDYPVDAKFQLT